MAIKRFTVEIDDSTETSPSTGATVEVIPPASKLGGDQTSSLDRYDDKDVSKLDKIRSQRPSVGRTLADIVVEFKDDARFMTVALFVISFVIFVNKLDSVSNFHLPLLLGGFLNLVWHVLPRIIKRGVSNMII